MPPRSTVCLIHTWAHSPPKSGSIFTLRAESAGGPRITCGIALPDFAGIAVAELSMVIGLFEMKSFSNDELNMWRGNRDFDHLVGRWHTPTSRDI